MILEPDRQADAGKKNIKYLCTHFYRCAIWLLGHLLQSTVSLNNWISCVAI